MNEQELKVEIEKLKHSADRFKYETIKKAKTSKAGRISSDVNMFQRFFFQVMAGLYWMYSYTLKPLWTYLFWPCINWIIRTYIRLWNFVVYTKDEYSIRIFSKVRAGLMIAATAVFIVFTPVLTVGLFDWALYLTTGHTNEKLILFGSQEVNALAGDHNVEGCPDNKEYEIKGCSDTDTVYFRTRISLFNEIWSLIYKHELYWPEYVGSAVPYTTSRCVADSYGVRWKLIMKDIEIYPTLLAVTCKPLEKKQEH